MAVIPVVYIVLCFLALRKYRKMLPEYYSALEKISLHWLQYILISLILLFIIVFSLISFRGELTVITSLNIFNIVAAIQSIYLFCIVFFSLRQSIIYRHNVVLPDSDKNKIIVQDKLSSEISLQLLDFMKMHRPYLDEELSLSKLSSLMGVSTHQLSQVVNRNLNTNFYKFVNFYRIEEAKRKLKNPEF